MSYFGYPEYVTVAEKRRRAQKEVTQLRKAGREVSPVVIEGTRLAETFWGKAWCRHLDSFADFVTRLPRGRTYVRTGAVCHLEINPGRIDALVAGSELYEVGIEVTPLPLNRWNAVKDACQGKIDDLLGLLHGKLPKAVLSRLCDVDAGLLPRSKEIRFSCSCPDRAAMCKHVAAVLYGVGKRLDTEPEVLFTLRQVDAAELLTPEAALAAVLASPPADTADVLVNSDLNALFGIDLDTDAGASATASSVSCTSFEWLDEAFCAPGIPTTAQAVSAESARVAEQVPDAHEVPGVPLHPLGADIVRLRELSGKTVCAFAAMLQVSEATLRRWEKSAEPLRLHTTSRIALEKMGMEIARAEQDTANI